MLSGALLSGQPKSTHFNYLKLLLTPLRLELSPDNIWRSRQRTTYDIINLYDSRWFLKPTYTGGSELSIRVSILNID